VQATWHDEHASHEVCAHCFEHVTSALVHASAQFDDPPPPDDAPVPLQRAMAASTPASAQTLAFMERQEINGSAFSSVQFSTDSPSQSRFAGGAAAPVQRKVLGPAASTRHA